MRTKMVDWLNKNLNLKNLRNAETAPPFPGYKNSNSFVSSSDKTVENHCTIKNRCEIQYLSKKQKNIFPLFEAGVQNQK